jgi:hypothetical protein
MVTFTRKSVGHRLRLLVSLQKIAENPPTDSLLSLLKELCEETRLLWIILVTLAALSFWYTLERDFNMLATSSP